MSTSNDSNEHKNAPMKGARRAVRRQRATAATGRRRLTVRSEQRETPDVRKIARAIIAIAAAQAEDEARARADHETDPGVESADA